MKRPSRYEINYPETVEEYAKKIMEWAGKKDEMVEYTKMVEDLLDECKYSTEGYNLAKHLDDNHYVDPDSELVEILDGIDGDMIIEHRKAVAKWVLWENIQPEFRDGDIVDFEITEKRKRITVTGRIYRTDLQQAQYAISVPSLGHVPEGTIGTQGIIMNYEEVRKHANQVQP